MQQLFVYTHLYITTLFLFFIHCVFFCLHKNNQQLMCLQIFAVSDLRKWSYQFSYCHLTSLYEVINKLKRSQLLNIIY